MTPESVVRLLAEPSRARTFAAIALGAGQPSQVAQAAGVTARELAVCLRRLQEGGLVQIVQGELVVDFEALKQSARALTPEVMAEDHGSGDASLEALLRTFVQQGRLTGMPRQWGRKMALLTHLADRTFTVGERYRESEINELLDPWCELGVIDRVTVRRYLVDMLLLARDSTHYWRVESAT